MYACCVLGAVDMHLLCSYTSDSCNVYMCVCVCMCMSVWVLLYIHNCVLNRSPLTALLERELRLCLREHSTAPTGKTQVGWRWSSSVNLEPSDVGHVSSLPTTTVSTGSCGSPPSRCVCVFVCKECVLYHFHHIIPMNYITTMFKKSYYDLFISVCVCVRTTRGIRGF